MPGSLSANTSVTVDAEPAVVWTTLTDPDQLSKVMLGAKVESEWREGSPITFSGEWQGKSYQDKGEIVRVVPERELAYTHWSPMSGVPDEPEYYHTVTYRLRPAVGGTEVSLSQSNVSDADEQQHAEQTWKMMLDNLKKVVEAQN